MNIKKLVVLSILVPMYSYAADSYLCVGELATGFDFNKSTKSWHTTSFSPNKFVVTKVSGNTKTAYEVKRLGTDVAGLYCTTYRNNELISCSGLFQRMVINTKNLRFTYTHVFGYHDKLSSMPEGKFTPFMQIGKCSPI